MIGTSSPRQQEAGMAIQFDDLAMPRVPALRTVGITVAIIMAVFLLGALAFSLVQQRVYGAEVDILFDPGSDMSDAAVERAFATQQVILRSPTVLQPVATASEIPIKDLERSLSIEIVSRSNVMRLTIANRDRATAVTVAQMIADEYQRGFTSGGPNSPERQTGPLQQQIKALADSLPSMQARLERMARARGTNASPSAEERQLQTTWVAAVQQISNLQDRLTEAQLGQTQAQATLLTRAHPLEHQLEPQPIRALAVGGLAGLVISAGAVVTMLWPRFATDRFIWE
jgi:uncharacterized protein involved in exopolysaccharide biosynthesis